MLQQVYKDNTISRTCVFEWHKRFKEAREEVQDDSMSLHRAVTEVSIKRVRHVVRGGRLLTARMIASQLEMKKDNVWLIITEDLGM